MLEKRKVTVKCVDKGERPMVKTVSKKDLSGSTKVKETNRLRDPSSLYSKRWAKDIRKVKKEIEKPRSNSIPARGKQ